MRFTVPQFIEYESKIVGPFTFKQFIFIGLAGAIAFALYYSVPFSIFLVLSALLGVFALALAFLKINGRPLPAILTNLFSFSASPKMYVWQKRKIEVKVFKKEVVKKEEEKKEEPLFKITKEGQLKKLRSEMETK